MDRESSRLNIITGPNMSGKSTYIRQAALVALMNQIGCFVPCDSATLPIFTDFMCRVGASDVQIKGISTFFAEMIETCTIVKQASSSSLVVIDELGRGTSTYEGFGLAYATAHHLVSNIRCYTLFATHFHEMCSLADATPGVSNSRVNAALDAATNRLSFLYAVVPGRGEESFGVICARMAGLPDSLLSRAEQVSADLEDVEMRAEQGVANAQQEGNGGAEPAKPSSNKDKNNDVDETTMERRRTQKRRRAEVDDFVDKAFNQPSFAEFTAFISSHAGQGSELLGLPQQA
eukprot:GHVU01008103.1.p1 GENE.GHVU01008103.1~~GHVU01008103.1.p1  ORF type:complete len:290 (-),score=49.31 GHVU01008103.1:403-1272(-)